MAALAWSVPVIKISIIPSIFVKANCHVSRRILTILCRRFCNMLRSYIYLFTLVYARACLRARLLELFLITSACCWLEMDFCVQFGFVLFPKYVSGIFETLQSAILVRTSFFLCHVGLFADVFPMHHHLRMKLWFVQQTWSSSCSLRSNGALRP